MAKNPSTLPVNHYTAGSTIPETDYLFKDSGLPTDVEYLKPISISAASDSACIIAGDPVRNEYGKVALKDIGTSEGFELPTDVPATTLSASPTATASAFTEAAGTICFAYNESTSSVTVFVKNAIGNSLSGIINVDDGADGILGPTV